MKISQARGWLYRAAKLLGDVQAATHKRPGKAIPKRIGRRLAGKVTGRLMKGFPVNAVTHSPAHRWRRNSAQPEPPRLAFLALLPLNRAGGDRVTCIMTAKDIL